jgi:2-keto-3-deoxy-L-fuconate dehydrogenase
VSSRLAGKTALVTGAGQGIGRASALAFAAEGAKVWATDRNGSSVADLGSCIGRELDVTNSGALAQVLSEAGPLDILFNCAGYVAAGTILECSEADWNFSFDLNVTAMYRAIRLTLPAMLDRQRGSIINMASVASSITGVANRFAYGASKAAVVGLTKGNCARLRRLRNSLQRHLPGHGRHALPARPPQRDGRFRGSVDGVQCAPADGPPGQAG